MKNTIYTLSLFLGCLSSLHADDTKMTINEAIRVAADQTIQSQRVARIYLALCNDMMEPKFYQERDATIELFDNQLRQLSQYAPSDIIKEHLQRVRDLWEPYKKIADWSIKKDAASKIMKQSTGMLQATKALYNAYVQFQRENRVTQESSDLLTIHEYVKQNTNQQVLLQRIVMYHLAEKQGIDGAYASKSLKEAQKIFLRMINILNKAKLSSSGIQTNLKELQQEWTSLEGHFTNPNETSSYLREFYQSADHISNLLDNIAVQYEDLAVKLSLSHSLNDAIAQTILVQKITKSYVASRHEALSYHHRKLVADYVKDFEQGIESMLQAAPTDAIVNDLKVVQTMWKNYKRIVTDFEQMDEIRVIRAIELCYVVMASCDRVTTSVCEYASTIPAYQRLYTKDGETLPPSLDITHHLQAANNLHGYSERITLYFMLKNARIDQDLSCKRLRECLQEFEQSLALLSNSSLNTIAAQKLLESCYEEWTWIKGACKGSNGEDLLLMVEHTTLLSKKLEKLCKLYEYKMNDMFAEDLEAQQRPTASAAPMTTQD